MHVTAIIAAGGRGERVGAAQPKQLLDIAGRSILERSVAAFLSHPAVDAVIVALPQELADSPPPYLRAARALQHGAKPLRVVAGGGRRPESVADALCAAGAASDPIASHH